MRRFLIYVDQAELGKLNTAGVVLGTEQVAMLEAQGRGSTWKTYEIDSLTEEDAVEQLKSHPSWEEGDTVQKIIEL